MLSEAKHLDPTEAGILRCPQNDNTIRRSAVTEAERAAQSVRRWPCAWLSLVLCLGVRLWAQDAPVPEEVTRLAREYLNADAATRADLARRLDASPCDPEAVVRSLKPRLPAEVKTGYLPGRHFETPELLARHPDDLLFIVVPESYRTDKPTGLIVLMHGGGSDSKRDAPDRYMKAGDTGQALGNEFAAGMIAVGPSAPWNEKSSARWCLPEADDYLRDVVLEMGNRFNIDPDRVVLMGYSMGGFGAYHQVQRQPDRFAAVLAGAGAWSQAYWPVIRGTPLWIVHGASDAVPGVRPHFTDVAYARLAHQILTEQGLAHEYREHVGGHDVGDARKDLGFFIARMPDVRRNPCAAHVVAATPVGWSSSQCYPASHNRWLSLLETTRGTLPYDCLHAEGARQFWKMPLENWQDWRIVRERRDLPGASVEAINQGENRFDVTTRNVRRFCIWLRPKMADFAKPIRVTVNGRVAFDQPVKPAVSTALASFERRRDWGLIYPAQIELTVEDTGESGRK